MVADVLGYVSRRALWPQNVFSFNSSSLQTMLHRAEYIVTSSPRANSEKEMVKTR